VVHFALWVEAASPHSCLLTCGVRSVYVAFSDCPLCVVSADAVDVALSVVSRSFDGGRWAVRWVAERTVVLPSLMLYRPLPAPSCLATLLGGVLSALHCTRSYR